MSRSKLLSVAFLLVSTARPGHAQRGPETALDPSIGYIYPAGARRGTVARITVGGQYLQRVDGVRVSGGGVRVTVLEHDRPMTIREMNQIRKKLDEAREKMGMKGDPREQLSRMSPMKRMLTMERITSEAGVSAEQMKKMRELRRTRQDPNIQEHPHLAETVTLEIEVAADAKLGPRELRVKNAGRLSNPLAFRIGDLPERLEKEPNDESDGMDIGDELPVVINGRILPGDIDRFSFSAHKGDRLVAACAARELIPYLADTVPGWFQATMSLQDANGKEVAFVDDYHLNPDPVVCYEVPRDGRYRLEIKDAIYRGRQDFVYRITLGEVPFVTSIFPLGASMGKKASVTLEGMNLPAKRLLVDTAGQKPGVLRIAAIKGVSTANSVPFAVDVLPDAFEAEPNDSRATARVVGWPVVVNGRIGQPGDRDMFAFEGKAGREVVAEIQARRLNAPLDSLLRLTDGAGHELAVNDDCADKGCGLITHHADSYLRMTLPADGRYFIEVRDTQDQGGSACAYRLRIDDASPDFALRVVPSSINARPGSCVPLTVYALRKDGFTGEIALSLRGAPRGYELSGALLPSGEDKLRLTLAVPSWSAKKPVSLTMEGRATIGNRRVAHPAVPADDRMQAFIYHHLVPAEELLVSTIDPGLRRPQPPLRLARQEPVKLRGGGTARARLIAQRRFGFLMDRLSFELDEPPNGVAVKKVSFSGETLSVDFKADAQAVKAGSRGNLIVNAYIEVEPPRRSEGAPAKPQKRRILIGALPAIPYEIAGL